MGTIILGIAGWCLLFCSAVKNALGYDDAGRVQRALHRRHPRRSAPASGRPCWAAPAFRPHSKGRDYDDGAVIPRARRLLTLVWSGVGTLSSAGPAMSWVCGPPDRSGGSRPRRSRRARLQLLIRGLRRGPRSIGAPSHSRARHFSPVRAPATPGVKTPGVFYGRADPAAPGPSRLAPAAPEAPEDDAAQGRCSPRLADSRAAPRA